MKIIDIIPLARSGKTVSEIAKMYGKSVATINRYISLLRSKGHKVPIKMGRPAIKVD